MKYCRRIYYSVEQRARIWDRWQRGEPMSSIVRVFDRQSLSVFFVISPTAGIRPSDRMRGKFAPGHVEREEISRGLSMKQFLRVIARQLGCAASTISREVRRNGGAVGCRAMASDQATWDRALRPRIYKLASHPAPPPPSTGLHIISKAAAQVVSRAGCWLAQTRVPGRGAQTGVTRIARQGIAQQCPDRRTIYRSLYIRGRGVLKKELLEHLRATHTVRRSTHASLKRNGSGQIKDAVSISERPAPVEDRAFPGAPLPTSACAACCREVGRRSDQRLQKQLYCNVCGVPVTLCKVG